MRRCLLGMMFVIATAALANAQVNQALPLGQPCFNRQADPIWDGALIGAGIAAAASPFVHPHARSKVQLAAVAVLIGAGWGAWFDYTIKDRTTIRWMGSSVSIGVKLK